MKKLYAFAAAALFAVAANAQTLYITGDGDFTGGTWNPAAPDQFQLVNGQYEIEVTNLSQFKMSTEMGDWDAFNNGVVGCDYGSEQGVAVPLEMGYSANTYCPWKGDYKIVVTADLSTITLTTSTPKPNENDPVPVYLRGDMNGWGTDAEWQFEQLQTNVYKFVCKDGQSIEPGQGFKVADADWGKINYGANETLLLDGDTAVFHNGENIQTSEFFNGVFWFVINLNDSGENYVTLSNDKSFVPDWYEDNSVEGLFAEQGETVYFNLQGQKVANPTNGIYVAVKNGKAVKVAVK